MQYLVIAYDHQDAEKRRLEVRDEHIKDAKKLMSEGKIISAGALIEDDKMVGSTLFVDFKDDEELESWLENEIYVKNRVWDYENIQIVPVKLLQKD